MNFKIFQNLSFSISHFHYENSSISNLMSAGKTTVNLASADWCLSLPLEFLSLWWKVFEQVIVVWGQIFTHNFNNFALLFWGECNLDWLINRLFRGIKFGSWFNVMIASSILVPSISSDDF